MYGLWLFKEIETEYGYCKVEIFRRGYNGSQIEIGALAANSLTISLENLGEITAPVGKSVCSFEIIDTDQINYDDFFTPDATAYKVVVSSRVGSGAYITRWSGYVTPDFFAENLSYRTPISISARDNIGYLNDVDFDLDAATITVRELITKAFARIAEDYPMSLSFVSQKQTAEGILAIDATISTYLLREMSWGEALETILHDLGLQMRWVDNNTIAVLDLFQIPEYYATQGFNFIGASGYREILPAWRQLSQAQDYGLRENFFEGWLKSENLSFVKSQTIQTPDEYFGHEVRYYTPNNWGVAREMYTTDPAFYNSSFGEKIIFSAVSKDNPSTTYMSWSTNILTSKKPLTVKFKAMNSVLYPYGGIKPYPLQLRLYDPFLALGGTPGDYLQIGMRFNLFLHTKDNTTYVMREDWVEDNGTGGGEYLNFTLDKISLESYQSQEGGSFPVGTRPSDKELTITANTIPYDGVLELRIYGYYVVDYKFGLENGTSVSHSPNFDKFFAYINEPIYTFDSEDIPTGQKSALQINKLHNVKGSNDYTFGEVPVDHGGINAYAGGLFKDDGSEMIGFQRNADSQNYNLLELVGREAIHFNKKNYNKLSGTIKNLDKEPLMFNRLFIREGKTYYPYNCSLNVISNEMNITTMQEVELYETASFTQIDSEVTTGGATVGGGNNTVLQYSEDAGNAKRVYELNAATEQEKKDGYLIIDNANYPEAKKVHISEVLSDLGLSLVEQDGTTYLKSEHSLFTEKDIFAGSIGEEGTSGGIIQQVYGVSAFGQTFDANNLTDTFSAHAINSLYNDIQILKNSGGGGVADSVDWTNVYNKPTTLGGYGITDALSTSGGTINGELFINNSNNAITINNGYLSYQGGTNWRVTDYGWSKSYAILHSGNYSDYALPLSGGTLSGNLTIYRSDSADGAASITYTNRERQLGKIGIGGMYSDFPYAPFWLDKNNNTYALIHSGNIGSYNAGSATKLQTARTIWGQPFDGTGDITGAPSFPSFININRNAGTGALLDSSKMGFEIETYANDVRLRTYTPSGSNSSHIVLTYGGNVLIGTSTDSGAKLQVNGNLTATGDVTSGSDARYKRIESHAEVDIETIANAPIINFKWIDREDDRVHLGSTAQYWANTSLCNGVIPTTDDKLWTMNYGTIALGGLVSVAKKVVNHEERIAALEKENVQLKQQLNEYRRLS